ncbi:MAG: LPS-assembly protein LptD [Bacteroidia bacterium]|nr:LPS-assembly protein LptD [Bacteroidia bacterium]
MKYIKACLIISFILAPCLLFSQDQIDSDQLNGRKNKKTVKRENKKEKAKSTNDKSAPLIVDSPRTVLPLTDTLNEDSGQTIVKAFDVEYGDSDIESPIDYSAEDSIVYDLSTGLMYLYGNARIAYTDITLIAAYIRYDWNTNMLFAHGRMDSISKTVVGKPVFSQGGKDYEARRMEYNFKTKRGKVFDVVTEEGGGYILTKEVTKNEYDEWYGREAKFTTCENEEPHFYIKSQKIKVIPDKLLVTGPANLVVADVPTPIYLPFGIFPVKKDRRSGIIFPSYGEATGAGQGFFLRNGGYYKVFNEHIAAAATGDIFSRGNWGLHFRMDYRKRYKVSGNLSLDYGRTRPSDPDLPGLKPTNDFRINWTYRQDPKAKPLSNITARVNASTSDYLRNSLNTTQDVLNTTFNSNITYEKRFRSKLLTLNLSGDHSQNLATKRVTISAPILNFNVARFNPFKSKSGGKRKWYEQIGVSYRFETKATVSTIDSVLISKDVLDKLQYGARHVANTSANFSVLKHFNISPTFRYTERWYFKTVEKTWDPSLSFIVNPDSTIDTIFGRILTDTIQQFKPARDFGMSLSLSTSFFGIFQFKKGSRIKGIKHDVRPSISIDYTPDFGNPKFGYYKSVQSNIDGDVVNYNAFSEVNNRLGYGLPQRNASSRINFSLANRLTMKVASKNDSIATDRKIGILDQLNLSMSYDLLAPEFRFSTLRITAVNRSVKNVSINLSTVLDPYTRNDSVSRVSDFVWNERKRLFRFVSTNLTLGLNFASKRSARNIQAQKSDPEDVGYIQQNLNQYYDFNQPWRVNVSYAITLEKGNRIKADTLVVRTHSINGGIDFNLTPKWKVDVRSGYDIINKKVTLTNVNVVRDLHCWELGFSWNITSRDRQSYFIQLRVKSSVLQELKLTKRSNALEQGSFF